MKVFIPNMYKKSIFDIDYSKLKDKGINCILFDLDNTILLVDEKKIHDDVFSLFTKLKKIFKIAIISNNKKKRISEICKPLGISFVSSAMKPFSKGFKKIMKKLDVKKEETAIIGDQIMTDILGGNRTGVFTILVDPLGKKDLKVTYINRFFEKRVINHYSKKNKFERGQYYE